MSTASVAAPRGRYHGMLQILRYNLPMYLATAGACLAAAAAVALLPLPPALSLLYDRSLWRGHRRNTAVHVAFTLLWLYLAGVFGYGWWSLSN